jgi:DNA-binding response OmpR family regulator
LVAEGYAVDYAEDGDEALWLAENNPYDAIILDVMMPLRDGFTRMALRERCLVRRKSRSKMSRFV